MSDTVTIRVIHPLVIDSVQKWAITVNTEDTRVEEEDEGIFFTDEDLEIFIPWTNVVSVETKPERETYE